MILSKWFSRKFSLALLGISLYSTLPIIFRKVEVTDTVTLAALSGITLIIGYYFKMNLKEKITDAIDTKTAT